MNEKNEIQNPRRYRGSLVGPAILIALGLVFLLNNLGLLSGDVWDTILRLWPILLIAIGLDGIFRREGIVGGVFLIGLGAIFLLNNFGYLAFSVWDIVIRLWPVLLIAIGFDVLVGRRSIWASLIGVVLVLVILIGTLWYAGVRIDRGQALQGEQVQQSLQGMSRADVIIEPGAASLHIHNLEPSDNLIAGRVATGSGLRINQSYSTSGQTGTYTLRQSGSVPVYIPGASGGWDWDLGLNPEIPIDLRVNIGAGSADLDLSGLQLNRLDVEMGVGQATINLPAVNGLQVKVNGAVGQLTVVIPQDVAARIRPSTALTNLQIASRYQKQGDVYLSAGYESAPDRIELELSQAIGQVIIR